MGLTESNQSKAAGGWGPSKSRSTPHFPDGRPYHNRPRQAATLPARPTPDSGQPPLYNLPRTPVHDPGALGHEPRPPEGISHRRDGSSVAGRSPGHRPIAPRRSASADSVKRRSDPLLDSRTMKHIHQMKPAQRDISTMSSSPRPTISPPSSPRQHPRQRPTAIYLADDQAAHLVRHREGRPRERGHSGRVHHGGTRRAPEDGRERDRGSCERRQKAIHVSTVTLTPQCPKDSRTPVDEQPRPTPRHQRRRKDGNKARARVEYSAAEGLHGDPYVCLHYGGTLDNGQRQQVTAWRTDHQEEKVSSSNTQLSQVVIRMNQVCSTTLDNYDAVNANVESVQVRRNVWFHANRTSDVNSDITAKNKTLSTAAINDHPMAGERETEMIRWPDVTNKVSSVYMRPEMHIAAVSCMKEGSRDVMYGSANPVVRQGRTSSFTSSTVDHGRPRDDTSGRDLEYARSRVAEGQGVATSERRAARHFSVYDDRRNYSKAPGRRKKSVLVPFAPQKKEKERLALPPSSVSIQPEHATQTRDEPVSETVKFKLLRTDDKKEEQRKDNVGVSRDYAKDKRRFECSCQDADGESKTYSSSRSAQGEVEGGSSANIALGEIEFDRSPAKSRTELKFGLRSHVEDYTVIEANDVAGQYYGCEDSDQERDESVWSPRQEYQLVSPDTSRLTNLREEPVCRESVDNASSFCDKVDKDSTTDSPSCEVNSSLFAWSGGERVAGPSSSEVVEALDGSVDTLTASSGESVTDEEVVKDSYPGTCDSSPQEIQSKCVEESGSRAYREALRMLEEKYWADTVSGLPTAAPGTHQCLNKWTSLPRHLQCARGRSADGDTTEHTMKGFRNRFKSLDVGNFVLRLPLGNQPRLVDVLRGAVPRGEAPADQPQGMTPGEEELKPKEDHNWHSNEECVSHSDPLCDDVTLVSYSECGTSARVPGQESQSNGCGNLVGVKCDALSSDGSSSRESETPLSVTEGESHLFHEDTDVPTIRKGDAGGVSDGKWSVSGELGVGGRDEARRRGSDPGWNMNESTVVKRRGHCVGEAAHTWHPVSGDLGARPRSTHLLQDTTQATTVGTLTREEDFSKLSRPVGRHVHKRSHGRVVRPSLHTIAWDTPVATTPTSPDCSYTCHEQCQDLVTLDCKADLTPDSHTSQEDLCIDSAVKLELEDSGTHEEEVLEEEEDSSHEELEEKHEEETQEKELKEESSKKYEEVSTLRKTVNRLQSHLVDNETLEAWVERYNATAQGLQISKESDGSFRGCIRVHLNLSRPINIVAGTRPPSIYDILQEDRTMEKTLTSFYMPRDAVKAIHVTSKTTTREVIVALLRKFKVVDNPQKFALYERTYDTAQSVKAKLRRLGDLECPLVLALNWSAGGLTNKRLVLQENDTADIQWEAFSLPELSNFLRILDREEEEYRCQIQDKYALLRRRIGNILFPNQQGSKD